MFLPEGEDPDTLVRKQGAEDFLRRLDNATPAIEYLFGELVGGLDLNAIDDRAKLASLAMPYVDRVPAGALKELMLVQVRELTGLSPDRTAQPAATRTRAPAARARSGVQVLADHLLAMLLKRPELLGTVSGEQVEAIVSRDRASLFRDVVKYVAEHPEADSAQILGRWAGDRHHDDLARLRQRGSLLPAEAVGAEEAEFSDGIVRLIAAARRHDRKRLVEEMREDPSREKLARFWTLTQGARADSPG